MAGVRAAKLWLVQCMVVTFWHDLRLLGITEG